MNIKTRIIKGHYDLKLIVGNYYRIQYGIHQGVYKYLGQETEGFWKDASIFENVITHYKFSYFGITTPYEFTSIVYPIKESEVNKYIKLFNKNY